MPPTDVNVAFLVSLGDTETWKNYRNSNLYRAISMKTIDLLAEVTLIDNTLPISTYYKDQEKALSVREGHKPINVVEVIEEITMEMVKDNRQLRMGVKRL